MSNPTAKVRNDGPELTFNEAAEIIGVSPRAVRSILKQHAKLCPVIKYGYRTKRFALPNVLAVKTARTQAAKQKGQSL